MGKEFYIIRNTTVEPLFKGMSGVSYSGYNDFEFQGGYNSYVWFYLLPIQEDMPSLVDELKFIQSKLDFFISSVPENKRILCFTMKNILSFNYFDGDFTLKEEINNYNNHLYHLAKTNENIKVLDFDAFLSNFDNSELIDWRHYYLSSVNINPKYSTIFQNWFLRKIDAINSVRKKCIILDLDNTIWGGILGEDGIEGIKIGHTYPGNSFSDLQSAIIQFKKAGVILAVCSKNNYSDVENAFKLKEEILLSLDDFSSIKINWNNKSQNILEISKELNIGLDSLVFLDDNPAERELVKKVLPQVTVPEFPDKPYLMLSFIIDVYERYFQIYEATSEDFKKAEQYAENALRKEGNLKYATINDFIKDLDISIEFKQAKSINIPRIAQLTQKTNQFNLTTKRYTEPDIKALISGNYKIWQASVKDKFGDHGITAVIIVDIEDRVASIDSFLLSCRILGYEIEKVLLHKLVNILNEMGVKTLKSQFVPSSKNAQTEMFFEEKGFTLLEVDSNNIKYYTYEIEEEISISSDYEFN